MAKKTKYPPKRVPRIRNRIYNCRKGVGLTQKELAFLLGITTSGISKWERGRAEPRIYNAIGLGIAIDEPLDDIFFDYPKEWQEKIKERKKLFMQIAKKKSN